MVVDTKTRLEKVAGELGDLILQAKKEPLLEGTEELLKAEAALKDRAK